MDVCFLGNNSSSKGAVLDLTEDFLEDQLVFGGPFSQSTPITYNKKLSFDHHLQSSGPAVLEVSISLTHYQQ